VLNSTMSFSQFSSNNSAQAALRIVNDQNYEVDAFSTSPFILVFNQQFDPRWSLTDSKGLSYSHIEVNGYANGWIIPGPGKFEFRLSFGPQEYYHLALLSSLASVIVALAIIVAPWSPFAKTARYLSRCKTNSRTGGVPHAIEPEEKGSPRFI